MATTSLQNALLPLDFFQRKPGEKSLLKFSTAGSVDDGKSTLIGRMLFDTHGAYDDQIEAVKKSKINRSSGAVDFSLLTDGLKAEREQGITIDVAWRYFATPKRKFVIADTPGHDQYTRNMATGASNCAAAVILVDARKGVLPQSRRHARISTLLGIRDLAIAVNKMDLVDFDQQVFRQIETDFRALSSRLGNPNMTFFPVSALDGDNIVTRSERTPWHTGTSLLQWLEELEPVSAAVEGSFRMPVQYVLRPNLDFRGFSGQISSGRLRPGDALVSLPSGRTSKVRSIVTMNGDLEEAVAPMSVTITLEDEIDISRGDLLAHLTSKPKIGRRAAATLVWMSEAPLEANKTYLLQHGPHTVTARITNVRTRIDVTDLNERPASGLGLNEIGRVELETARALVFDPYTGNRKTGSFVLVDSLTNATVAAGLLENTLGDDGPRKAALDFALTPVTTAERTLRFGHSAALVEMRREEALLAERILFEHGARVIVLTEPIPAVDTLLAAGWIVIAAGWKTEHSGAFLASDEQDLISQLGKAQILHWATDYIGGGGI